MDLTEHSLTTLFEQLGLASTSDGIDAFVRNHRLPHDTPLCDAPFWNPAQAGFLREALMLDSDWAEPVDHLDVMLRR